MASNKFLTDITVDGKAGIGTSSPSYKLDVSGTVRLKNSASELIIDNSAYSEMRYGSANYFRANGSFAIVNGPILKFEIGGAEKMRVHSDGNVGIGTTSPSGLLHLKSSTSSNIVYVDTNDNALSDSAYIRFNSNRAQVGWIDSAVTLTDGGGNKDIKLKVDNGSIFFMTSNTARMFVNSSGNVGIGTTSPNEKLQLAGNLNAYAPGGIDAGLFASTAAGSTTIALRSSGVTHFNGGNVGIGTTSPVGKLTVQGDDADIYLRSNDYTIARIINRGSSGTNLDTGLFSLMISDGTNNDVESVRLDAGGNSWLNGGNVGIGTSSPGAKLEISSGNNVAAIINSTSQFTFLDFENDGTNRVQVGNASDGDFIIRTSDSERLRVNSDGNVGIGTTAPDTKLHLADSSDVYITLESTSADTAEEVAVKYSNSSTGSNYWWEGLNQSANWSLGYGTSFSGSTTRLLVDTSGNVGIGTTSPGAKLDIHTATNSNGLFIREDSDDSITHNFYIDSSDNGVGVLYANGESAKILLNTAGNSYFNGGNVGIGTTDPSYLLHVNGNARVSNLYVTDDIIHNGDADTNIQFDTDRVRIVAGGATKFDSNLTYLNVGGDADDYTFEIADEGNLTGNKWYHVATLSSNNGGMHIRGAILNHVESFSSQKLDIAIQVREGNSGENVEITGSVDVLHNASGAGTDKSGVRVIQTETGDTYNDYKVYVRTCRYSMVTLRMTKKGAVTFNTDHSSPLTTEPSPTESIAVELDTSTLQEGNYVIDDSTPREIHHAGNQSSINVSGFNNDANYTANGLATTGGTMTGNLKFNDSVQARFGTGNDLKIYHEGTDSIIQNYTGSIYIDNNADDQDIIFRCDDGSNGLATYLALDGSDGFTKAHKQIRFLDSVKATFGNSDDLQINHNGTHSWIQNFTGDFNIHTSTGNLYIYNETTDGNVSFQTDNGSGNITEYFRLDGAEERIVTSVNHRYIDDAQLMIGTGADLKLYHDGSNSYINDSGTGELKIASDTLRITNAAGTETSAKFVQDSFVELFHNNFSKFKTTTYGVEVTGGISSDGNAKSYTWRAVDNTSNTSAGYHKIARVTSSQSTRFVIEIAGRSTSYGDGDLPAMGYIVGQLNNDNNYDIIYYNHHNGTSEVVAQVGQVDVDATQTDIYVKVGDFAEVTAHAHISDGSITVDSSLSGDEEPTNYVAATEVKVFNSGGDISLGDSKKIKLGNGDDLQIYHDGSHSFISDQGTGDLTVMSSQFVVNNAGNTENMIIATADGSVNLYHNGTQKFRTVSTGVEVTAGSNNQKVATFTGNNSGRGLEITTYQQSNHDAGVILDAVDPSHGTLKFQTSSSDAMVIDVNQNVGIGTTSPGSALHVAGAIYTTPVGDGVHMGLYGGTYANIQLQGSSGAYIDFSASGTDWKGRILYDNGSNYMRFDTSASERMRITASGNVGIGTTNPQDKLDVVGKINSSNNIVSNSTYTMFTGRSNRTVDDYGGLNKQYFKLNLVTPGPDTTGESSAHGFGDLRFQLANNAGSTAVADIMTLRYNGNVGIGTTSPDTLLHIESESDASSPIFTIENDNDIKLKLGSVRSAAGTAPDTTFIAYDGDLRFIADADSTTEVIRIDSSGNVGIGTTNPSSANGFDAKLQLESANPMLVYKETDQTTKWEVGAWGGNYVVYNGTNERMRIDSSGNVGIGTDNPGKTLDIAGEIRTSGRATFNEYVNTSLVYGTTDLNLGYAGGTSGIFIKGSTALAGNVGIGTTNPVEKLQINSGDVLINNSTISTLKSGGSLYVDLNTFGSYSGRNFRILDNGTSLVNVKQTGEFGIGTTDPATKLDVKGITTSKGFQTDPTNTDYNLISRNNNAIASLYVQAATSATNQPIAQFNYGSATANAGTKVLLVAKDKTYFANTNVGIGTTNPSTLLDIRGAGTTSNPATSGTTVSTGTRFRIASSTSATAVLDFGISTSGKSWLQSTDRTDLSTEYPLLLNPNGGKVGIGTDNPGEKLHVAGNIRATGWIGENSSNRIEFDESNNLNFYVNGVWVAQMQPDGDLHVKGDVIAFSSIFDE